MRSPLIMGNWKLHGSNQANKLLIDNLIQKTADSHKEIVVCPPYVYLHQVHELLKDASIKLGAQTADLNDTGAFTGEISIPMLHDVGCQYLILGHSERRSLHNESDALIALKFKKAIATGLIPVLCVGESLEQFESGQSKTIVRQQLQAVLAQNTITDFKQAVIAYEPIWAIGTGKTATPEIAQTIHASIRDDLRSIDVNVADKTRILYGGSVKDSNAKGLLAMPDIDGALVGGASLDADAFSAICHA